ncbi:uridine kinase family protein [Nocardioides zhouii]|uniref:Uridine kinase n=1 Tax=Nocardioides zhouii TaxID=1168729 RepID=A0A4Q2SFD7_9ACTN|nr:uridine kinase [Nocardioides zhouii]RYC03832.1 uridine kinase [Nocardioides zhouii]
MTTPKDVLSAISRLDTSESKRPLLICIDGLGGSGKSTMAVAIRDAPEVLAVVEGDDFYGPAEDEWAAFTAQQGYERFFDHERLAREVLRPLRRGEDTRYQRYDWQNNVLGDWVELPAQGVVAVEGVYMLRPQLREFWDLSLFVDTPWPIRLDRQVSRGQNTEQSIKLWTDAEKYYERTFEPASRADFVLPGH